MNVAELGPVDEHSKIGAPDTNGSERDIVRESPLSARTTRRPRVAHRARASDGTAGTRAVEQEDAPQGMSQRSASSDPNDHKDGFVPVTWKARACECKQTRAGRGGPLGGRLVAASRSDNRAD